MEKEELWGNLGNANNNLGEFDKAVEFLQQSLTIMREIKDSRGEGLALCGLGTAQISLQKFAEAQFNLNSALTTCRLIGAKNDIAYILRNLAFLNFRVGHSNLAQEYCEQALMIATDLGLPLVEECRLLKEELEKLVGDREG